MHHLTLWSYSETLSCSRVSRPCSCVSRHPCIPQALRKRSVWIEPLFGEAKQWHQLVQFRLRRLEKVNIQALLIAAGQNIKRLLKARRFNSPLRPAQAAALALPPTTTGPFLCNFWFTKVEAFSFSTRWLAFAKHFFNTLF